MRVLERKASDGVSPIILIQFGSLNKTQNHTHLPALKIRLETILRLHWESEMKPTELRRVRIVLLIWLSRSLEMRLRREIGPQSHREEDSGEVLGMGTTIDVFQVEGKIPEEIDKLMMYILKG